MSASGTRSGRSPPRRARRRGSQSPRTSRRIAAEPSPTPAVKTSASRPPSEAVMRGDRGGDAMHEDRERERRPGWAERSQLVDRAALARRDRARPESVLERVDSIASTSRRRVRRRCSTISGSIEPERVAIGTPSSGLKPIVVSTERPSRTAVTEQPPPRWHTTSAVGSSARARPPMRRRARGSRSGGCPSRRASARGTA